MRTLTLFCYVRREKRGIQGTSESVERITAQVRGEEETCLRELSLGLTFAETENSSKQGFSRFRAPWYAFPLLAPTCHKNSSPLRLVPIPTMEHDSISVSWDCKVSCAYRVPKSSPAANVPERLRISAQRKRVISHETVLSGESEKLYTVQAKVGSYVDATST
jgi:hypothetical protein